MTPFVELGQSLANMGFPQLVLALAFLASYSLMLTGLSSRRAERCAVAGTWLSAAGFVALTDPWVHGVMLVVFIVGAMGLFIAAVWVLNRLCAARDESTARPSDGSRPPPLPAAQPRGRAAREVAQTAY